MSANVAFSKCDIILGNRCIIRRNCWLLLTVVLVLSFRQSQKVMDNFGAAMESSETPLLRHLTDATIGVTLLDVAQATRGR